MGTGYIIPDPIEPTGYRYMVLCVPDDIQWSANFSGALFELTLPYNWLGVYDDQEAAARVAFDVWWSYALQDSDCMTDFCEIVADCIANNQSVQDALREFLRDQQKLPDNNSGNPLNNNGSSLLSGVDCDLDSIYGACVAIEDYIHALAGDFIEVVTAELSDQLATARLIDFFPIVGDLPFLDDINDLVDWIITNGNSSFAAGYNTVIRQDNICDMFERACGDCELTMQDIIEIYAARGGLSVNIEDAFSLLINIIIGTATDQAFVAAAMMLVASAVGAGGSVSGITGLPTMEQIAASGTPSDDWETFCDPCSGTWTHIFDFTADDGSFVAWDAVGGGVWIDGVGWRSNCTVFIPSVDNRTVIRQSRDCSYATIITACSVEYLALPGGNSNILTVSYRDALGDNIGESDFTPTIKDGAPRTVGDIGLNIDGVHSVRIAAATGINPCGGQITVSRLTLSGIGTDPFE